MEKIGTGAKDWLADLERRIDAGEFARGQDRGTEALADRLVASADDPIIGWAIARPTGRGFGWEFWDAERGRWTYDSIEFDGPNMQHHTPRQATWYHEKEHAEAMLPEVDETKRARVIALVRTAPEKIANDKRRAV